MNEPDPLVYHGGRSLSDWERRQKRAVAHYRRVNTLPLVPAEVFGEIAGRYGYVTRGNWRRARCAALAACCLDLERLLARMTGGRARRLVAERFNGLLLGVDERGAERRLALSQLTLWRALLLWQRGEGCSPAIFTMQTANSGRRPKGPQPSL